MHRQREAFVKRVKRRIPMGRDTLDPNVRNALPTGVGDAATQTNACGILSERIVLSAGPRNLK